MKLIDYARKIGISYKTTRQRYKVGNKEDLLADLTAILYTFCAHMYGLRRAKRKTETIVMELEAEHATR